MDGPLVSIIIPVYNVESRLEKCVTSVRRQTYSNLEIILVDDGSTDSCGQLCNRFSAEDFRIRVIHKENGGVGSARNAGLDMAQGTYIYFVDSDDWVRESLVEETVSLMERHGYDQCIWGTNTVKESGENYYEGRGRSVTLHFSTPERKREILCRWLLTYRLGLGVWSQVCRREIIERNRLRFENEREIGAEDLDFSFRYLACCQNLHYTPKPFYVYQRRSGSIMGTNTLQKRAVRMLRMIRRWEETLSGQPLFQPFYAYSGAILVFFASDFFENQSVPQGLAQMLSYFQASENWDYLLEQAHQARKYNTDIRRVCGLRLGGQVCAFYQYILDRNPRSFCRWEYIQKVYRKLRDIKSRLQSKW